MPNQRKINFQGREVIAESVEFESDKEQWSTYILHDGSTLKVKAVVAEVSRLLDVWDPKGDPVYMIQASQVVHVSPAEPLRRKE